MLGVLRSRGAAAVGRVVAASKALPRKLLDRATAYGRDVKDNWGDVLVVPAFDTVKSVARFTGKATVGLAAGAALASTEYPVLVEELLAQLDSWTPRWYEKERRALAATIFGRVLELEPGSRTILGSLSPGHQVDYACAEPRRRVVDAIYEDGAAAGYPRAMIDVSTRGALEFLREQPTASADAVVSTGVLGGSDGPDAILREAGRVLRPGGRLFFVERTALPGDSFLLRAARDLAFLPLRLVRGTSTNVLVTEAVENAGFSTVVMQWWPTNSEAAGSEEPAEVKLTSLGLDGVEVTSSPTKVWYYGRPSSFSPVVAGIATKVSQSSPRI